MNGLVLITTLSLSLLPKPMSTASTGASLKPPLTTAEQRMVVKAQPYLPSLKATVDKVWPDMAYPSILAAQIEKESLWNPRAELCVPKPKCSREYGFGFGQITITQKFNVFEEIKKQHPDLRTWTYEDRFNPDKQLLSVVVKDKSHFRQCLPIMKPGIDVYACAFSSYNGGYGGVLADRRVCSNTQGCDPTVWFSNIENTSMKQKVALPGYGESFFQINRGYVKALIKERPRKYSIVPGFQNVP
jgi:hypothetical protein